jgi:uncharacterized membrane protein YphA (DoxX/SURF4 family)
VNAVGRLDWDDESHDAPRPTTSPDTSTWDTDEVPGDPGQTVQTTLEPPTLEGRAVTPVTPPAVLLVAAGVVALLSGVLLLAGTQTIVRVAGYLLGTIVTIGLVAAFYREDLQRRQSSMYSPRPALQPLAIAIVLIGFFFAVLHVWRLARSWT